MIISRREYTYNIWLTKILLSQQLIFGIFEFLFHLAFSNMRVYSILVNAFLMIKKRKMILGFKLFVHMYTHV